MTSKEKAEELIQKYLVVYKDTVIGEFYFNRAKECALIAVDEVKESSKLMPYTFTFEDYDDVDKLKASVRAEIESFNMYWNEVKQEIEKL